MSPDEIGKTDGKELQKTLSDETDLDESVIRIQFSSYGVSIGLGFSMEELITG